MEWKQPTPGNTCWSLFSTVLLQSDVRSSAGLAAGQFMSQITNNKHHIRATALQPLRTRPQGFCITEAHFRTISKAKSRSFLSILV